MSNPHKLGWIAASVPKPGSRAAENEDATAADAAHARFAVADGATEGWQSRGWAKHLAAAFIRRPPTPADFKKWLALVRRTWTPPTGNAAAWYTEVKQEQGSFATLLGLEFREATSPPGLVWKAVAIGDSCLFRLRGTQFDVVFPISRLAEFGNQPPLVPSSTERDCPEPEWLAGWAEPGDVFLLATDAVSRFILESTATPGSDPIAKAAQDALSSGDAARLVELLNALRETLNDDASVVAVRVPAPPEPPR